MIKLAIGALTCKRPVMFAQLLDSLVLLNYPEDVEVTFIFVENSEELSVQGSVDRFAQRAGDRRIYLDIEPVRGIGVARNRVLNKALELQCDFLAFIDDDEVADPNWIVELLAAQREFDLDLVCGPVRDRMSGEELNPLQKWVAGYGMRRIAAREARRLRPSNLQRVGEHAVLTVKPRGCAGNWFCRLALVRTHSLKFNQEIGLARGEDHYFLLDLLKVGGRVGQAPKSLAYQTIPASRLTPGYRYHLKREAVYIRYRLAGGARFGWSRAIAALGVSVWKLLHAGIYIALAPLTLGRSFVSGVEALGFAVGLWQAMRNVDKNKRHYSHIHGF